MSRVVETKSGWITQNGCWISLKTMHYSHRIEALQELVKELSDFLTANDIEFDESSFEVNFASNSTSRLHCVTIMVVGKCESLPFQGDAIN